MSYPSYPEEFRSEVVAALMKVQLIAPVARAYGISTTTARKWALADGVKLPSAHERIRSGALSLGQQRRQALLKRWRHAQKLRAKGKSLVEIAAALGYKSEAMVHYILQQEIK